MSIIIRLQNLPLAASAEDIRRFFDNLVIPDGGVHIIGGEHGDAFIVFGSDEDARLAMLKDGGSIKNTKVKLLLSSRVEMQKVIDVAKQQAALTSQNLLQTLAAATANQFDPNALPMLPNVLSMLPSLRNFPGLSSFPTVPAMTGMPAVPPISTMTSVPTMPTMTVPTASALSSTPTPVSAPSGSVYTMPPKTTDHKLATPVITTQVKNKNDTPIYDDKKDDKKRPSTSSSRSASRSRSRSRSRDRRTYRDRFRRDRSRDRKYRRDRSRSRGREKKSSRSRSRDRYRRRSHSRDRKSRDHNRDRERDHSYRSSKDRRREAEKVKSIDLTEKSPSKDKGLEEANLGLDSRFKPVPETPVGKTETVDDKQANTFTEDPKLSFKMFEAPVKPPISKIVTEYKQNLTNDFAKSQSEIKTNTSKASNISNAGNTRNASNTGSDHNINSASNTSNANNVSSVGNTSSNTSVSHASNISNATSIGNNSNSVQMAEMNSLTTQHDLNMMNWWTGMMPSMMPGWMMSPTTATTKADNVSGADKGAKNISNQNPNIPSMPYGMYPFGQAYNQGYPTAGAMFPFAGAYPNVPMQPGMPPTLQSGIPTTMQPGMPTNMQPGIPIAMQSGMSTGVQPGMLDSIQHPMPGFMPTSNSSSTPDSANMSTTAVPPPPIINDHKRKTTEESTEQKYKESKQEAADDGGSYSKQRRRPTNRFDSYSPPESSNTRTYDANKLDFQKRKEGRRTRFDSVYDSAKFSNSRSSFDDEDSRSSRMSQEDRQSADDHQSSEDCKNPDEERRHFEDNRNSDDRRHYDSRRHYEDRRHYDDRRHPDDYRRYEDPYSRRNPYQRSYDRRSESRVPPPDYSSNRFNRIYNSELQVSTCVELQNVPLEATGTEVKKFFAPLPLFESCIKFLEPNENNRTRSVFVKFINSNQKEQALQKNGMYILGSRVQVVDLSTATYEAGKKPNSVTTSVDQRHLMVSFIPKRAETKNVSVAFSDKPEEVHLTKVEGRESLVAYVKFSDPKAVQNALKEKHNITVCGSRVKIEAIKEEKFLKHKSEITGSSHVEDSNMNCDSNDSSSKEADNPLEHTQLDTLEYEPQPVAVPFIFESASLPFESQVPEPELQDEIPEPTPQQVKPEHPEPQKSAPEQAEPQKSASEQPEPQKLALEQPEPLQMECEQSETKESCQLSEPLQSSPQLPETQQLAPQEPESQESTPPQPEPLQSEAQPSEPQQPEPQPQLSSEHQPPATSIVEPVSEPLKSTCVLLKNLPPEVTDTEIVDFFGKVQILPSQIHIMFNADYKQTGESYCEFRSTEDAEVALKRHQAMLRDKSVSVVMVSKEEVTQAIGVPDLTSSGSSEPPPPPENTTIPPNSDLNKNGSVPESEKPKPLQSLPLRPPPRPLLAGPIIPPRKPPTVERFGKPHCVVALENVPVNANVHDIIHFFGPFNIVKENVIRRFNERGMPTGDFRVALKSPADAQKAARSLNGRIIFGRFISVRVL